MIDRVSFSKNSMEDYVFWQSQDRRKLKKINKLIRDIAVNGNSGLGNPRPLENLGSKDDLAGYFCRNIDRNNHLIYRITDDRRIEIIALKGKTAASEGGCVMKTLNRILKFATEIIKGKEDIWEAERFVSGLVQDKTGKTPINYQYINIG